MRSDGIGSGPWPKRATVVRPGSMHVADRPGPWGFGASESDLWIPACAGMMVQRQPRPCRWHHSRLRGNDGISAREVIPAQAGIHDFGQPQSCSAPYTYSVKWPRRFDARAPANGVSGLGRSDSRNVVRHGASPTSGCDVGLRSLPTRSAGRHGALTGHRCRSGCARRCDRNQSPCLRDSGPTDARNSRIEGQYSGWVWMSL